MRPPSLLVKSRVPDLITRLPQTWFPQSDHHIRPLPGRRTSAHAQDCRSQRRPELSGSLGPAFLVRGRGRECTIQIAPALAEALAAILQAHRRTHARVPRVAGTPATAGRPPVGRAKGVAAARANVLLRTQRGTDLVAASSEGRLSGSRGRDGSLSALRASRDNRQALRGNNGGQSAQTCARTASARD
jgi:hypothetical protein